MFELAMDYERSCDMLMQRINELIEVKKALADGGENQKICELDLERRIRLLYADHRRTKETAEYLKSYARSVEARETKNCIMH